MVTVMKIIDLSHTIAKTTPVFPGSEKPQLATVASYEKDGYRETLIRMYSHTGTHIDPPAHVYEKGLTLDALPHRSGDCHRLQTREAWRTHNNERGQ